MTYQKTGKYHLEKGLDKEIFNKAEYSESDLVKMDILLNGEVCDALSIIVGYIINIIF